MNALIPVVILIAFVPLALIFGSSTSGRVMTARKIMAGCGVIFFAVYGVVVPDERSESLMMTALAVVMFYYLIRESTADKPRE